MRSDLSEFQAKQIIRRMHLLRQQVDLLAIHAKTLSNSSALDGRVLLQEATSRTESLIASRIDFQTAAASSKTLTRTLPSRPPKGGEIAPSAQWGSELRAAAKQFADAVKENENALQRLFSAADLKMSSPRRTPTGDPTDGWQAVENLIDLLVEWRESRKPRAS